MMSSNRVDYSQPMRSRNGSVSFSIGIHPLANPGDPSYLGFSRLLRNELSYSDTQLAMKRRDELEMKRLLGPEVEEDHMGIPETASLRSLARRSLNRADNVDEGEDDAFNEMEVDVAAKKRRRRHRRRSGSFTGGANPRKYRNLVGYAIPYPNAHNNDWRDMLIITEYQEDTEVRHSDTEIPRNSSEGFLHPRDLSYPPQPPPPLFHQMKFTSSNLSLNRNQWIQDTFYRRECSRFVPTNRDPEKCGCGRVRSAHIDIPTLTENLLISQGPEMIEKKRKNTQDEDSEGIKIRPRRTNRNVTEKWSLRKHTILLPTDAFGQIEFQGGPHPYKAQYVRLSFDTDPAHIMSLFEHVWQIAPPKLIITVHGGTGQFDLQAKLARVFRKGLLKAALTTGAWIFTSGVDSGVVKHVAAAWEGAGSSSRSKVVCIGITPWGILKKRDELIGADKVVPYYSNSGNKTRLNALNNRHSYFLLVDNGTVGRYGGEVILRKRLETYIGQKQKIFGGTRSVPVVSVVLEGGSCTIRAVLDYVTNVPRVPVVICDGSGRAADMLAFAHQTVLDDGTLPDGVRPQLKQLVERVFNCPSPSADRIVSELVMCAQQKHLMTIFRLGERHDVDHAILTALLKGQNLSPFDQLSLALAWNRVDIARSDIFAQPYDWPQSALYNAMMEALIHDRVDFVRLLLENGVSMQQFLTIGRLEELYNTDKGPPNTLYYIVRDVVKIKAGYQYRLPHIGMVIEKLMGNAYKSSYTSRDFRQQYSAFNKKHKSRTKMVKSALASAASRSRGGSVLSRQATEPILGHFTASMNDTHALSENMMAAPSGNRALSNHILWRSAFRRDNPINPLLMQPPHLNDSRDFDEEIEEEPSVSSADGTASREFEFRYPYSELLIWAVLTKRQEMALCMWQHGEEAMAKALIACRLYKSLATEAAEDYLEVEICDELKKYSEDFRMLSMELLEHCYQQDDTQTLQLLTYELSNWGRQTCLSLAVVVNNKQFLAHPCCQILLADLWHGGLRIRSHSNMKVIMGLICFPFILSLEFKSREELMNQPQRAAEHEHDIAETSSSSSSSSSSSDGSSSDSSDFDDDDDKLDTDKEIQHKKSRKMSHGSVQSLNLATIFQSRHRRRPKDRIETRDTDISCNEARVENGDALSYGTFVGQAGTISPPSFVRKRLQSWKDPISRTAKSDVSTKTSIAGSKTTVVENGKLSVAVTKESGIPEKLNRFAFGTTIPRMRQIKLKRKFYEFFAAPITTFWGWCISFMVFMCTFTVVLLIRTPLNAAPVEWFLFFYVFAFGCEYFRKFIMSEMEPLSQKIRYFFSNFWNTVTITAIVMFFIGFAMRLCRSVQIRSYGRVVLACDSVLWAMKLLDYASVHPKLGPYITMAGKMIQNMVYIIIMLMVALLGFGLARQSITYPNEDFHWLLVRNIFYKPYFMLYGEVYADEIDTCGDEAWDTHFEDGTPLSLSTNGTMRSTCVPGHWIPPILTTIFLLIANILLMSMLIAIFNHIFDSTTEYSQQIWLFERYRQVMEYESTPVLPPPFTPISHLAMLIQYIRWRCCCVPKEEPDPNAKKRHVFDYSLKLFLSPDQVEKLHDFEEDCMDDLSREKEHKQRTSNEERIYRTAERTETILSRVMELQSKETTGRETLVEMDTRLQTVEKNQLEMLELMRILASQAMRGASPEPDIGINLELIVDSPEEEEDEEVKSGGLAPLPLRKRLRTNTICGADRQTREDTDEGGLTSPLPGTFRTRFSSMASLDASARQLHRHSKRRRHDAYTSITDGIIFDRDRRPFARCHSNIEAPDSPNLSDLPHSGDETQMKKSSLAEKRQLSDVVEALQKKEEEEDLADCELTMSEIDETMTNVDPIERRSTVGSKDGIMFEVVDEEQRVPQPSPQRVDSPKHPL